MPAKLAAKRLADLGVTSRRLHEARQIRDAFTDDELEEIAEAKSKRDEEISRKRLLRVARERKTEAKRKELTSTPPTSRLSPACAWCPSRPGGMTRTNSKRPRARWSAGIPTVQGVR